MQARTAYFSALNEQAQRQLVTYWRVRIGKTLEQFETEVRRMLRVESSLEGFAVATVMRLGDYMEALRHLPVDEQLAVPKAPFDWVAQQVAALRRQELKTRYHRLASELHPDNAEQSDAALMRDVNDAYSRQDLAMLVRLEAQVLMPDFRHDGSAFEDYVRQVEQATATYRQGYSQLLNSPLYALYARATSAQEDGWDYIDSLARRLKRAIEASRAVA